MEGPDMPIAVGIIRDIEEPTYDNEVNAQIRQVQANAKVHNFDELTMTAEHWQIG
jgi:2-oxoglutarate ferredoxin oxidoreductase subunit beta